jgi:hypothetical protein
MEDEGGLPVGLVSRRWSGFAREVKKELVTL